METPMTRVMFMLSLIGLMIVVGLVIQYIRLILKTFDQMISNKHKRLRRNWGIVFAVELTILVVGITAIVLTTL